MKYSHGGTEARRGRRAFTITLIAWAALIAGHADAGGWEIEASFGGYVGSSFQQLAPFEYGGLKFGPLYKTCDESEFPPSQFPAESFCRRGMAFDVLYAREWRYVETGTVGLEVRRRLGDSFAVAAGALGGLAARREKLLRESLPPQVTLTAPLEPQTFFDTLQDRDFRSHYTGVGTLAYLHAGFRYERGFESRTTTGYRASSLRVFFDGGGGVLPVVPGGDVAKLGTPPAFHVGAGLRFHRVHGALTFSVLHVHALGDKGVAFQPHFRWTGFRVGWVRAR